LRIKAKRPFARIVARRNSPATLTIRKKNFFLKNMAFAPGLTNAATTLTLTKMDLLPVYMNRKAMAEKKQQVTS
jgi:hypothetical protein